MVKEQLIIDGVTIPIDKGISTILTFSIKDIQQPDKIKSSYSKTIKLPGSKAINDKLNFIFEVNSDSTFNPNLKLDAVYYQDDIAVFSGFIQLKDVIKKDYNQVDYQVVLFGETANIFRELGNKFLNDTGMLWDELDHDYTKANQQLSWATSYELNSVVTPFAYGSGLTYPMVNYGNDTDISLYYVEEMFPAVFAKEYIDRMFLDAGYTYSSTFLTGAIFKRLIIPFNGKQFKPTQTDLSPRTVKADTPLVISSGLDNYTLDSSVYTWNVPQYSPLRLSNETVDVDNQYNPTTGVLTVGDTGFYRISFNMTIQADITPKAGSAGVGKLSANGNAVFKNAAQIKVNGTIINAVSSRVYVTGLTPATLYSTADPTTYPDADYIKSIDLTPIPNNPPNYYQVDIDVQLTAGDLIGVDLASAWGYNDSSTGSLPVNGYDAPFYDTVTLDEYHADFKITLSDANLALTVLDTPYVEGDTIDMYSAIPDKIKQRDFLTSIIKMFNLYMIPDPEDNRNMIIETRADFYTTDVVDWSGKLDYSKAMNLTPTAVTNKQKYTYTYKQDKDYYNGKYEASWLNIYGSRDVYLDNDFNKTDHKTELIFSPTPMVGQLTNDRVISTIIDVDSNLQQKTIKSNIRVLYYGGLKNSSVAWIHESTSTGSTYYGEYPYAAHLNDPFTPTIDINFGLPREIYYNDAYGVITLTDANLYNTYHRKELEQLTDKDSKIFKGYFLLDPVDIANLSFRSSYWFDNGYWNLHKVSYGSSVYQPSKCEFLKLKQVPTPTVFTGILKAGTALIGSEDSPGMDEPILSDGNVLSTKSSTVDGKDNFIDKTAMYVDITGDSNKVFSNSKNIYITGDSNTVYEDVENVTLINTSNITVRYSDTTYIDGQQVSGEGCIKSVVAGTKTVNFRFKGYEADCTNGECELQLPLAGTVREGMEMQIKKMDATAYKVKITAKTDTELIDGETEIYIVTQYDNVTLRYNVGLWSII